MKNNANLRKSVITIFAVLLSGIAFSQFSRQQAIDLVLNTILQGEIGTVNVHASFYTIPGTVPIEKDDYISSLYGPYTNNWVFFVDDIPVAKWAHPCRYIFVSGVNGDYQAVIEQMYPMGLVMEYELISHSPVPPSSPLELTGVPLAHIHFLGRRIRFAEK